MDKDSLLTRIMEVDIPYDQACEVTILIDAGFSSSQIEKAVVESRTTDVEVLLNHMTQEGM